MHVRYDYGSEPWDVARFEARLDEPRRELPDGACKHGIRKHEDVVQLQEHGRVPYPERRKTRLGSLWIVNFMRDPPWRAGYFEVAFEGSPRKPAAAQSEDHADRRREGTFH